jgi:Rieske Fe-S protein
MSDELGAKPHYETGPYVHYCEHLGCTKWGSFGFAVGRAEPNWFCSEHRPEWNSRHEAQPRH